MTFLTIRPALYLVPLRQKVEGLDRFISSWIFKGETRFLVDVGPKASISQLLGALEELDVERVDFIFLTHIHIDHAGGVAALVHRFPEARVVCHPAGRNHLIHPEKLWEGSKRILGDLALHYGEIDPVPASHILSCDEFSGEGFEIVKTPGHAVHHMSLVFNGFLFVGEAGGVFRDLGNRLYLRPSTPPRFILEEAIASIDRLLQLDDLEICYAHFGIHRSSKEMLRRYKEQLYLWKDVIAEQMRIGEDRNLVDRCREALVKRDPFFSSLFELGNEERNRELYFLANNIRGLVEYLSSGPVETPKF